MSNVFLYIVTVLIWGSTFFAIEFQLGTVAPEVSLVYRFGGAALLLFAWCRLRRLQMKFPLRHHLWFAMLGVFLFGLNYVLAYRAQIHITSALTAIAFSTVLWMNIINSRVFFGVRSTGRVLIGAALGIAGILILFVPQMTEVALTDSVFIGSVLAVASAITASVGNMVSQGAQRRELPVMQGNAWGMFYGFLVNGAVTIAGGHSFQFEWSFSYVASLVYLTVFGSIFAFGAYLTLLGRIGAHRAAYSMVLFPVVALILSVLFEGLRIDGSLLIGTALVLAGNVFVLRRDPSPSTPPPAVRDNTVYSD